jgi:hypothetical protein
VVASVIPTSPPTPFVSPPPHPSEQVAHFDPPPPAVIENAMKKDGRRSTIVVAVAPPAETSRPSGGVVGAAGEIDTGSRRVKTPSQEVRSASIMVADDHQHYEVEPPAQAAPAEPPADEAAVPPQQELRLEDLPPARALPSARGRATKRRKTTTR